MSEVTGHPAYARLLELLRQRIGLDPGSVGTGAIPAALEALGVHGAAALQSCVDALHDEPAWLDALVQRIVVHETWFFRDPAAFDVLADTALRAAAEGRCVRVLSAPCSTGEEAYSIAMALVDAGLDESRFEVVGVDLSARAIAQARSGVFGELAFRARTPAWRDARFEPAGRLWRLRGRWPTVRFEVGNLLDLPASIAAQRFDAVFCRNLLIYLDGPARERVANTLRRLVRPHDGLLCVGPSESTDAFGARLERVPVGMSFAFWNREVDPGAPRRAARAPVEPARAQQSAWSLSMPLPLPLPLPHSAPLRLSVPLPLPLPIPLPLPLPLPRRSTAGAPPRPQMPPPTPPPPAPSGAGVLSESEALFTVRRLAEQGDRRAAGAACDAVLARCPGSADAHALRGRLAADDGEAELGLVHLGRALYLEPRHRDALQQMALLQQARGDAAASRRCLDRLQRLGERDTA